MYALLTLDALSFWITHAFSFVFFTRHLILAAYKHLDGIILVFAAFFHSRKGFHSFWCLVISHTLWWENSPKYNIPGSVGAIWLPSRTVLHTDQSWLQENSMTQWVQAGGHHLFAAKKNWAVKPSCSLFCRKYWVWKLTGRNGWRFHRKHSCT